MNQKWIEEAGEITKKMSEAIVERLNDLEDKRIKLFLQRLKERVGIDLRPDQLETIKDKVINYRKESPQQSEYHLFWVEGGIHLISFFESRFTELPKFNLNKAEEPLKFNLGIEHKYA